MSAPDTVAAFEVDYQEWADHRADLVAQEERGSPFPHAGDWHDSDDRAVELLRRAAQLLR
jgi:hypothetical protein